MKTQLKQFIADQTHVLDNSIVATPDTRQRLEAFANANHGSADILLMQMAIQFGYYMAIEDLQEEMKLAE